MSSWKAKITRVKLLNVIFKILIKISFLMESFFKNFTFLFCLFFTLFDYFIVCVDSHQQFFKLKYSLFIILYWFWVYNSDSVLLWIILHLKVLEIKAIFLCAV